MRRQRADVWGRCTVTGAHRVVIASLTALLLTASTMLGLACPRASTLGGQPRVAETAPSTAAKKAFPLTILQCSGGLSRISIDEQGIVEFERSSDRGEPRFAKASIAELTELRGIVESDVYRRAIAATDDQRDLPVCGVSPFVRIAQYGKIADFEDLDGPLTPDPITRLLGFVRRIQSERFPDK